MQITRTANAGVLLKLDGVTILLDGVCREVKPYPATPPEIKSELMDNLPDVIAFSHAHKDHYDPGFAAIALQKNGVILGPDQCRGSMESLTVGKVRITPISSRHIGAAGKDTPHVSFVIEGSKCIWFTGDASPTQWRQVDLPKPDVMIVPYAYCTTPSAWLTTQSYGAQTIILVHMPFPEGDSTGLWSAVRTTVGIDDCVAIPRKPKLFIPNMNETVMIQVSCD